MDSRSEKVSFFPRVVGTLLGTSLANVTKRRSKLDDCSEALQLGKGGGGRCLEERPGHHARS